MPFAGSVGRGLPEATLTLKSVFAKLFALGMKYRYTGHGRTTIGEEKRHNRLWG
jgi:hypothetical protein